MRIQKSKLEKANTCASTEFVPASITVITPITICRAFGLPKVEINYDNQVDTDITMKRSISVMTTRMYMTQSYQQARIIEEERKSCQTSTMPNNRDT